MESPIYLLANVGAGFYSAFLIYALAFRKMITISSHLRETAISVTMMFVGAWYLVDKFPYVIAVASVLSWLVYNRQLLLEARGRASRMSSGN